MANIFSKAKDSGQVSCSEIKDKFEESNQAMLKEQWSFILNRAMLHGQQWVTFDTVSRSVAAIPREPDRLRCTFNRIWPATRHLMAKLLSRPLVFEVAPSEADDASVRGAHTAEAVLEAIAKTNNWENVREQLAWTAWLGGTAVLGFEWDQDRGKTLGYRQDGSDIGGGDIYECPLNILEVAWEPGAKDAEKAMWWIKAQALPPTQVQAMYGLKDLPPADATAAQGYLGRTLTMEESNRPRPNLTLVLTYFERPTKGRPKGAVATVVDNKFVDGPHDWPFPFKDRLNMVVFRETKVQGRAQGDTVMNAVVPMQVAYNQSWSNILEHIKLAGNARMLVPDAALDGIEELTDLPGEILNYNNAAGKPEWMTPAAMQAWVIENPRMIAEQMDDTLGLHEISRGVAPSGIESGVGLSVLVEQDSTPLGALTREMAFGFQRYACLVLETYAALVKDTRKAKLQQRGQSPEIVEWNGKSLAGQTEATVPMDAVMPRSRTALLAFAKELWDRKIIQDPEMFTRIADLPDQDNLLDAIDADKAKAQRCMRDLAVGRIPVPRDFDDHAKSIEVGNKFRKTLRYESLPEEFQSNVDMWIQAHETMAAEEAGQQVAQMNVNPALAAAAQGSEPAQIPQMAGMMEGMPGAEQPLPGPTSGSPAEMQPPPGPGEVLAPEPGAPTPS
jgi:hypothetical protein